MISPSALREISRLQSQADQLLAQRSVSRADAKKADLLISKIAGIRQLGLSSLEVRQQLANEIGREIGAPEVDFSSPEQRAHEQFFKQFISGVPDDVLQTEARATLFQAGQETPIFSPNQGHGGGVLCPVSFNKSVFEAMAAVDPLLDSEIVSVEQEDGFRLPALTVPGWDLTDIAATIVAETSQHNTDTIPQISNNILGRFTYRAALTATMEYEQDAKVYGSTEAAMARAFAMAFARGVGADLVNGDGTAAPFGALTQAVNSGFTTANAGKVVLEDFTDLFFSVNKAYRESPKAAWLVSDATMKLIRNAKDSALRPLVDITADTPEILGKPVYVAPSMPSGAGQKVLLFGDLSKYLVHRSAMYLRRSIQAPGLVEYGKARFDALMIVDAVLNDPTEGANSGALSPVKYSTQHA